MRVEIIIENQFRWLIKHGTHGFKNKKVTYEPGVQGLIPGQNACRAVGSSPSRGIQEAAVSDSLSSLMFLSEINKNLSFW